MTFARPLLVKPDARAFEAFSVWVQDHFATPSDLTKVHRVGNDTALNVFQGRPIAIERNKLESIALAGTPKTNLGHLLEECGLYLAKGGGLCAFMIGDETQYARYMHQHAGPHLPAVPLAQAGIVFEHRDISSRFAHPYQLVVSQPGQTRSGEDGAKAIWQVEAAFADADLRFNMETRVKNKLLQHPHATVEFRQVLTQNVLSPHLSGVGLAY